MNHVGTFPPLGRHGIPDPVKVSYNRLLLVPGTVGLRQRLGPHVRTRNDGNSGIGPAQDLRFSELLTSRDTGSKGSRYDRQPNAAPNGPVPSGRWERAGRSHHSQASSFGLGSRFTKTTGDMAVYRAADLGNIVSGIMAVC